MRTQPYDLGEGTVLMLEAPPDLQRLTPRRAKLVPPYMVELWREFPRSIIELSRRVSSPVLAKWLRAAAESRATIAIYDTRDSMPPKAFLHLDFGLRETPGGSLPWTVLIDCLIGKPKQCPDALAEIYACLGGIATQYGASGTLITPGEVVPLSKRRAEAEHLFDEAMGAEAARVDPRTWRPYYECDGDYLGYRPDGRSQWLGFEWVSSRRLRSTRRCVDDLFGALLSKKHFHDGTPWP